MRALAIRHGILGFVALSTILWLDLVSAEMLARVALYCLVWAAASTLLVATAGAVIALARMRRDSRQPF
ncbi:hypothetical protein [Paracraurococcus lichenis]|uniref:Uncharacterized protein n=1 Tax=Paracraurococcus lichenis TaxID=3064888 RepID=A0ABT9E6D0_9PROT|nr:hypothetical protein [Paracraurococcus sp. LOR1-02]MDO9711716.1 hypothetical protein [Paracraurococcus sp. LOR1-02]